MTTQKHFSTICYDALAALAIVASAPVFNTRLIPSSDLLEEDILLFVHPLSNAISITEVLVRLHHDITRFLVMSFPVLPKLARLTIHGHASASAIAMAAVWLAHLAGSKVSTHSLSYALPLRILKSPEDAHYTTRHTIESTTNDQK